MGLLLPLLLCILATCCNTRSVPLQVPNFSLFHSHDCNDTRVLDIVGLALKSINDDRKEGYVLSLNRVRDVQEHRQDGLGSLFYLTLDVLETKCHVLTKKAWSDCEVGLLHESVYGKCKAILYVNLPRRIVYLPAYNCTLRPVSRREIAFICPDCPISPSVVDMSDPRVLEAVTESLAKFNNESTKQYSLVKVSKTSSQWVFGSFYFVEYLIKESPCTESPASSCALQPPDSAPVGLCKGSLIDQVIKKDVSVTCNFFESQASTSEDKNSTEPTYSPTKAGPRGSVQHLPNLTDEMPEESLKTSPVEAFPVQLDLTTNPQGETLNVSFLFLEPMSEKLIVLPFPKEQHSAKCPGPAKNANPLVLPP
ncbi:fetuin-B-like [Molossus molossus]|uniref:Fetuin B n=1 Tax=Molossus molossus TaxID=27622 RepID=A0A7J8HZS6_MOLMO|nr:fetuin-B-like [Molossus molossus]KAF6477518.1 fetuin B [Molossus molossus]